MPSDCPEDEFSLLMEKLTDEQILACETAATDRLFNFRFPGLAGRYGIMNRELVRHEATVEQMRQDAARFGIDPAVYQDCWWDMLLEQLSEAWDEEFYEALLAKVQRLERTRARSRQISTAAAKVRRVLEEKPCPMGDVLFAGVYEPRPARRRPHHVVFSETHKTNLANSLKGRTLGEDHKKHISEAMKEWHAKRKNSKDGA